MSSLCANSAASRPVISEVRTRTFILPRTYGLAHLTWGVSISLT